MTSSLLDPTESTRPRRWMTLTLALAAAYNLAWGAWVVLDPLALFRLGGIAPPAYPAIWQCVGMIVGVYGVGYAIAATAPLRHWPIVLVGLLGKVLGPIGFARALADDVFPTLWGWTILANDLVWWLPFSLILAAAYRGHHGSTRRAAHPRLNRPSIALALRMARDQHGESLLSLSRTRPRLVVCLRHLGCTFCRETLAELSRRRSAIEARDTGIVLVHPAADDVRAAELFDRHGLADLPRVADPARVLYGAFGLSRGGPLQVLGPRVWWRAAVAAVHGHRPGRKGGDPWQMPGVFLVEQGRLIADFQYHDVSERPDFLALIDTAPGRERAEPRRETGAPS